MTNKQPDFSRLHPEAIDYLGKMAAVNAPALSSFGPEQVPQIRKEFNTGILRFLGAPVEMASVRDITAAAELRDIRLRVYTPEGMPPAHGRRNRTANHAVYMGRATGLRKKIRNGL